MLRGRANIQDGGICQHNIFRILRHEIIGPFTQIQLAVIERKHTVDRMVGVLYRHRANTEGKVTQILHMLHCSRTGARGNGQVFVAEFINLAVYRHVGNRTIGAKRKSSAVIQNIHFVTFVIGHALGIQRQRAGQVDDRKFGGRKGDGRRRRLHMHMRPLTYRQLTHMQMVKIHIVLLSVHHQITGSHDTEVMLFCRAADGDLAGFVDGEIAGHVHQRLIIRFTALFTCAYGNIHFISRNIAKDIQATSRSCISGIYAELTKHRHIGINSGVVAAKGQIFYHGGSTKQLQRALAGSRHTSLHHKLVVEGNGVLRSGVDSSISQSSNTATAKAVVSARDTEIHRYQVLRYGNVAVSGTGPKVYVRKSGKSNTIGTAGLRAPVFRARVPFIICFAAPVQVAVMLAFDGHHTGYRGGHSSTVHRDTAINEIRRFPAKQCTGRAINENLITARKAVQIKGYVIHRQGSSCSHTDIPLSLSLLESDMPAQCALPGKGNILQSGIFCSGAGMKRHTRQHGSILPIRRFNNIMRHRNITGNRAGNFSGNQHFHVLKRAALDFIGTDVQRNTRSERKHTFRNRGTGNGAMHRIRNMQRTCSVFHEGAMLIDMVFMRAGEGRLKDGSG